MTSFEFSFHAIAVGDHDGYCRNKTRDNNWVHSSDQLTRMVINPINQLERP